MLLLPEHARRGGLGRVVLAMVALLLVAPVGVFAAPGPALLASAGLIALPLAALSLVAPPRRPMPLLVASVSVLIATWWLLGRGELLDQTIRSTAVLATGAFLVLGLATRWAFTSRALLATGVGAAIVAALYPVFGSSWNALHWWSEYRAGYAMRLRFGVLWGGGAGTGDDPMVRELGNALGAAVQVMSDLFPALLGLHLIATFAVATALHRRLAGRAIGAPPGPFRAFRFSEHLGWLMVVSLIVVLVGKVAAAKLAAWNLLTLMGTLYVIRGLAVAAFGMQLLGGGVLLAVLAALAIVFLLPVVLGAALLVGVLDGGLDLRRRWTTPRDNE